MRRELTPRGAERRAQLMSTAACLFAERGYDPTSVGDVVEAIGVGKGVFYWYFSSKEELFAELLRAGHHDLRRRQEAAIGDEPDPLRRIEAGIGASLDWFGEHRDAFTLFQIARSDERFAPALRKTQQVAVADTVRHLKDAIVEGQIPDRDPEMLAQAILGVVERLTLAFAFERGEAPRDVAADAVAFCLDGLRG